MIGKLIGGIVAGVLAAAVICEIIDRENPDFMKKMKGWIVKEDDAGEPEEVFE